MLFKVHGRVKERKWHPHFERLLQSPGIMYPKAWATQKVVTASPFVTCKICVSMLSN